MLQVQLHLIRTRAFLMGHRALRTAQKRTAPDRGSVVQDAIWIALMVAATIAIAGILIAKAKSAANGVKTQ